MKELKDMLIRHEGLRLKPYKCTAGKTTIGVGRNLEDRGITSEEAMMLLDNDIASVVSDLRKNIKWFENAKKEVQVVLADMCFNMGIYGLLKFKNTLSLLENQKYKEASKEMLDSLWAKQVGSRAKELSNILKSLDEGNN